MSTEYEKLVIKIETDLSSYQKGMKRLGKENEAFASDVEKVGKETEVSAKRGEGAFARLARAARAARAEVAKKATFGVEVDDSSLKGAVTKASRAKKSIEGTATVNVEQDGAATTTAALNRVDEAADNIDGRKVALAVGGVAGAVAAGAALKGLTGNADVLSATMTRLGAQKLPMAMAALGAAPAVISAVAVPTLALGQALGAGAAGFAAIGGAAAAAGAGGLAAYAGAAGAAVKGALDVRENMLTASQAVATADDAVRSAKESLASATPGTAEYAAAQRDLALASEEAADAQREFQRLQTLNTPAAQAFNAELDKQSVALTKVQAELGNRVLPSFTRMMEMGREALPQLTPPLYEMATAVSGVGEQFVEAQLHGENFGRLSRILSFVGDSGTLAATGIARMANAGLAVAEALIPAAGRLQVKVLGVADGFDEWANSAEGSKRLGEIISGLESRMYSLGGIVGGVGAGLVGVFSAINESGIGDELLADVEGLATGFSHVGDEGSESRDTIISFARDSMPVFSEMMGLVGDVGGQFGQMASHILTFRAEGEKTTLLVDIFRSLREQVGPLGGMMVEAFEGIGPHLPDLIENLGGLAETFAGTTPVLEVYLDGMNSMLDVFNGLPDPVKDAVANMAAFGLIMDTTTGSSVPGLISGLVGIWFNMNLLRAVQGKATIGQALFGTTAAASGTAAAAGSTGFWALAGSLWATVWPIAAVVGGIALVGTGLVLAYKHIEPFKNAVDSLWMALAPEGKNKNRTLGESLAALWGLLKNPPSFEETMERVNGLWAALAPEGSKHKDKTLGESLSYLWGQISRPPDYEGVLEVVNSVWSALAPENSDKKSKTLGQSLSDLWTAISRPPDYEGALEVINGVWAALAPENSDKKQRTLGESLSTLWGEISRPPDYEGALEVINGVWQALAPENSKNKNKTLGESLSDLRDELTRPPDYSGFVSGVAQMKEEISSHFDQMKANVTARLAEMKQSAGENIGQMKTDGLARIGELRDGGVSGAAAMASGVIERSLGMKEGTISNFLSQKTEGVSLSEQLGSGAITAFQNLRDGTGPIFGVTRDRIVTPIGEAKTGTISFLNDIISAVNSVLTKVGLDPIGTMDTGGGGGSSSPPRKTPTGGPVAFAQGGVVEAGYRAFATGGVGGMGTAAPNARMHLWNEQHGGEAFIAEKRPAREQLPYLQTAADWHGYAVIPANPAKSVPRGADGFASGGLRPGGIAPEPVAVPVPVVPFNFGGAQEMWQAVKDKFGVEGFNNHAGYLDAESAAKSIDWMVTTPGTKATGSQKELGDRIAAFTAPPSAENTIWYGAANFGGGWQPYSTGPGVGNANTLGHYDHVHAEAKSGSFQGGQGSLGGSGISVPNPVQVLFEGLWSRLVKPLVNTFLSPLDDSSYVALNAVGAGARKVPEGIYKWIDDQIPDTVGGGGGPGTNFEGGGNPTENRKLGQEMLSASSVGGSFASLDSLWTKESGWNQYADNPTSDAYGIPQGMMGPGGHTPPPGYMPPESDPAAQIDWGLNYISGTYGSTDAAWSHSQQVGWYKRGGVIPGADGESVLIQAHAGERVLPREVVSSFDRLASSVSLWSARRHGVPSSESIGIQAYGETGELLEELQAIRTKLDDVGLSRPSRESIERGARRVAAGEIFGETGRKGYESHSARSEKSYAYRGGA